MDVNESIIEAISKELKQPTSHKEQVQKLKERGLIIEDEERVISFLENINYYHLTGYLHNFKNINSCYKDNLTFQEIENIIHFDLKLRNIFLYQIEMIEMSLKTNIAYAFSHNYKYGNIAYYFSNYFLDKEEHSKFIRYLEKSIEKNKELLFIKHHKINYSGYIPIWVVIEIFTLGNLEHFYSLLNNPTKKNIAKNYGYSIKQIENWIYSLRRFRNMLAHNGRLYNFIIDSTPVKEKGYKESSYKIFDYVLVVKYLSKNKIEWNSLIEKLEKLFEEYEQKIELKCIGFPERWKEILK